MKFLAVCSKNNQKLTLSVESEDISGARNILHNQGFSIIQIDEARADSQESVPSNFFYFDSIVDGVMKSGQIQSDDIFRAYKKLVHDLGQDIVYIYTTKNMLEEQKKIITAKVKSGYQLYLTEHNELHEEEKKDEKKIQETIQVDISSSTRKQIEHYSKIIDQVIEKLSSIILGHADMSLERRTQLESLQQALYQAKASTNIEKLKIITETALVKIGKLELEYAKQDVTVEKKELIESTNKLLKQVGSKARIETNEAKQEGELFNKIQSFFNKIQKKPTSTQVMQSSGVTQVSQNEEEIKTQKLDTNSFVFYKNLRELKIYKNLLKNTEYGIFKALFMFRFSDVHRMTLKRKLVYQNIQIIENRIANKNFSYTKIVKGFSYYIDHMLSFFRIVEDFLVYVLLFIGFVILISHALFGRIVIRDELVYGAALLSMFIFLTRFFGKIFGFLLGISFFVFYFIFMTINF